MPGVEMSVSSQDLLVLTNAVVGDIVLQDIRDGRQPQSESFTDRAPPQGVITYAPSMEADKWVEDLEVLLIWRSKIGRRLLFCGIVPANSQYVLPHGADVYRNVWRWNESCEPLCEDSPFQLQLLVGKTLTMRCDHVLFGMCFMRQREREREREQSGMCVWVCADSVSFAACLIRQVLFYLHACIHTCIDACMCGLNAKHK